MRSLLLLLLCLVSADPAAAQLGGATEAAVQADAPAAEPATPIELSSPDREIEARLDSLLGEIDGLGQVEAEVDDGVVTLTGTVLSAAEREEAQAVAARVKGVVSVENDVALEHRIDRRIGPMVEKARELFRQAVAFLPLLLLGLLALAAFWLLGRFLTRSTRLFGKIAPNPLIHTLIAQIVRLLFIVVGLIIAMRIIGAAALLGTVLGAAGVLGLAIGFAVRDTVENYIASILLSVRRPFDPNDHVIIEGFEGRVTRLNSRATFLTSFDGNELRIPNAIVYKAKITNFTQIPDRRFEFLVGVGYENDLERALALALAAAKSVDGVLARPEPEVVVDDLGAYSVAIKVLGWVDQRSSGFFKVRGAAIRAVKKAFDDHSISMPAPIQNIQMIQGEDSEPRPASRPSPEQVEEVSDTSADRTIERKVAEIRAEDDDKEDLLTMASPKE